MARASFGGGVADFIVAPVAAGDSLRPQSGLATFWDAETAGTRYTDLLLGGDPVEEIPVGVDGQIPTFQGPDSVVLMWAEVGGGARVMVDAAGYIATLAQAAADAAETARAEAVEAKEAAEAVGASSDAQTANNVDTGPLTGAALSASLGALAIAGESEFFVGMTQREAVDLRVASLAPPKDATPTLDELRQVCRIAEGSIAATTTRILFVADATMVEVDQFSLACTAAVAGSTTNYWSIKLAIYRGGVLLTAASKTTKPTANGGEPITAYRGWNFDATDFAWNGLTDGDVLVLSMTPTGTPDPLVGPVASFRMLPVDEVTPLTPISITDSFNRANASTLGNTDTGQTWVNYSVSTGVHGISSNTLYPSTVDSSQTVSVVETATPDATIQAKYATIPSGSGGLVFRMSDKNNGFMTNQSSLFRWQAGALTSLAAWSGNVIGVGDSVRVVLAGDVITVYKDAGSVGTWVQVAQVTDSFNDTATKHGIRSGGPTMDNFSVVWP